MSSETKDQDEQKNQTGSYKTSFPVYCMLQAKEVCIYLTDDQKEKV